MKHQPVESIGSSPAYLCIWALNARVCNCTSLNTMVTLGQKRRYSYLCRILSCSETSCTKKYAYGRPEIVKQDWGDILEVYDPFGNRLRFCQSLFILLDTKELPSALPLFFIRTLCPLLAHSGRLVTELNKRLVAMCP